MNNDQSTQDILIGTLVNGNSKTADYIRQIIPHGFESFSITFWQTIGDNDIQRMADEVKAVIGDSGAKISSVSIILLRQPQSIRKRCTAGRH